MFAINNPMPQLPQMRRVRSEHNDRTGDDAQRFLLAEMHRLCITEEELALFAVAQIEGIYTPDATWFEAPGARLV